MLLYCFLEMLYYAFALFRQSTKKCCLRDVLQCCFISALQSSWKAMRTAINEETNKATWQTTNQAIMAAMLA
jgi:hypothetical protein